MKAYSTRRRLRKVNSCPDLFDWAQENELLSHPAIRSVARRLRVSPATASVVAELAGIMREARHD
jgi:hypothetical protein